MSFEMPLSDYECNELESVLEDRFKLAMVRKHYEDEHKNDSDDNMKAFAKMLGNQIAYDTVSSANSDKMFKHFDNIMGSDRLEPTKIGNSGVNMFVYYLFGFWKRGFCTDKQVHAHIESMYNKHREFHKQYGKDEFAHFVTYVALGIVHAEKYYEENMRQVVEDQIKSIENAFNHDETISL